MTKKNIRSEYVKNLLAEKDNLGAMLSESTSEAIKSYLGESVNKGIRNILSEAEDSFTEEEVDDATPKIKKNSEKDSKKSKKDNDKKSSKNSKKDKKNDDKKDKFFVDDDEDDEKNDSLETDNDFDDEIDIEDDFDSNDDFDDEGNDQGDDDDFDSEDETDNDFDSDVESDDDDDFDADGYDDMESGDYNEDSDNEVWDSVEQFMGEDGEYDLTGQDKDTVMKVLKVMKPEDGVRIVKNDNGTYELNDENNDVEYIISLNEDEEMDDYNEMNVEDDYRFDNDGDFEEEINTEDDFSDENGNNFDYDEEVDVEDVPNEDGFGTEEFDFDEEFQENDDNFDPMDDECLNEDNLGYDPHYGQDKTAMTMPSDTDDDNGSKIKMNAGLPKGSKNNGQRWVGDTNGKMAPYSNKTETLYEVELEEDDLNTDTTFNSTSTSMPSTNEASTVANGAHTKGLVGSSPKNRADNNRAPHKSGAKKSNENFERKVKAIMAENKELKKIANEIKKRLEENVVVNASLGKIIKLMVENSTTKDEKVNILNRFNNVKSVKESKQLYEAISRELKQAHKNNTNSQMFGNQITEAKKTKQQIVENKLNESSDVKAMREFIERLDKIS